jgi:prepilin-type N-terminal cleavage/methylation domain-containing protein
VRRAEEGFTLVEVLVALVMTSILLTIIIDGAAGARARSRYVMQHEDAVRLGQSIIARAADGTTLIEDHGTEAGLDWKLSRTALATDPRGFYALMEMRVDITSSTGKHLESFSTRRLRRASAL